jgi:clathrin heavy chain
MNQQPFMINMLAQQSATIEALKKDNDERKAREAASKKDEDSTPILGGGRLLLTQGPVSAPSPGPGGYAQPNGIPAQPTGYRF